MLSDGSRDGAVTRSGGAPGQASAGDDGGAHARGHGRARIRRGPIGLAVARGISVLGRAAILGLAVLALPRAVPAAACPGEDAALLFHSCHGGATAELLLLPEEAARLTEPGPGRTLVVTGAYTGADQREGGLPNPVGLFVDQGRVINPNLARMEGILVIGADGQPRIRHAARVPANGGSVDLGDPAVRLAFAARAAERGLAVMQSHLLIVDGRVDVSRRADAPKARRRMLFSGADGWGVYQTKDRVTLFDAAQELEARFHPDMALNLDMGSYDYCLDMRDGVTTSCGVLGASDTARLSNALRFSRTGAP